MSARLITFPPPVASDADFQAACSLEVAHKLPEAITAYEHILARVEDPRALINLGTIVHTARLYHQSEALYRRATVADPQYTLAWFNLGNALDELIRTEEAVEAYRTALRLCPQYADAHYNLAVALEQAGKPSLALNHYRAFLKLDSTSLYATQAQMQVWRIVRDSKLQVRART